MEEVTAPMRKQLKTAPDSHGIIDIHFTGIWDTVVALGFPKGTDVVSPVSLLLKLLFEQFETFSNWAIPHQFYYFRLTTNQKNAYQALALDDARTAFYPHVWDEKGAPEGNVVEQVWFAGMHSNVGGGYGRSGLASVPLFWMIGKAQQHGLCFEDDKVKAARIDSHVHGRMYDSRDGAAIFYRYHPREIESLCRVEKENRSRFRGGKIRIHDSVIERMEHRTANYAPCILPEEFEVVKDELKDGVLTTVSSELKPGNEKGWDNINYDIQSWIKYRKKLYDAMVFLMIVIVSSGFYYWTDYPVNENRTGFMGHIADIMDYILPDFFAGLIEKAVYLNSEWFWGMIAVVTLYMLKRAKAHREMSAGCQDLRKKVMNVSKNRWGNTMPSADTATETTEVGLGEEESA